MYYKCWEVSVTIDFPNQFQFGTSLFDLHLFQKQLKWAYFS